MARQLATIEQLSNVRSHDNADALELATVRGWQVVVKLGEFASGDTVVYFEIDSMLDHSDERFAFLAPRGVRTDVRDGFSGHVLRTAKLRGQISQGLVLPVDEFAAEIGDDMTIGRDLTEILGLRKWDPPLPADLSGKALGQRPGSVPKTDAERVQNIDLSSMPPTGWIASEKIDGTSTSYLLGAEGELRVCTRNLELAPAGQLQWTIADELGIREILESLDTDGDALIQGELAGLGIQGNPLGFTDRRFFVFRLLVGGRDIPTSDWPEALTALAAPVVDIPFPSSNEEALESAEQFQSVVAPGKRPEGIVWRYEGDEFVPERIVKAISNKYLLKQKD